MAKVTCAISGLELSVSYFPMRLRERENYYHPIFLLKKGELIGYVPKALHKQVDEVEGYLLYLALFNSTGLMSWNQAASFTKKTPIIVAKNIESLARTIGRIDIIKHPSFQLPKISINQDTRDLENSGVWIQTWNNAINDFLEGNKTQAQHEALIRREAAISKLLNNLKSTYSDLENIPIELYAARLASWAALAGEFPASLVYHDGKRVSCSQYWEYIIRICASEKIVLIPKNDILELYDHIVEHIDKTSSLFSNALYNLIKIGLEKATRYQTLGLIYGHDISLEKLGAVSSTKRPRISTFQIMESESDVQDANLLAMISTAPESEPRLADYPSKFEYLRAKTKYDEAIKIKDKSDVTVEKE